MHFFSEMVWGQAVFKPNVILFSSVLVLRKVKKKKKEQKIH